VCVWLVLAGNLPPDPPESLAGNTTSLGYYAEVRVRRYAPPRFKGLAPLKSLQRHAVNIVAVIRR